MSLKSAAIPMKLLNQLMSLKLAVTGEETRTADLHTARRGQPTENIPITKAGRNIIVMED